MKFDIQILAALVVAIPVTLAIIFSTAVVIGENQYGREYQDDHKIIMKLQNITIEHNNTLNGITNFLLNTQLPFDCKLVKVNDTTAHCIEVMRGGK